MILMHAMWLIVSYNAKRDGDYIHSITPDFELKDFTVVCM